MAGQADIGRGLKFNEGVMVRVVPSAAAGTRPARARMVVLLALPSTDHPAPLNECPALPLLLQHMRVALNGADVSKVKDAVGKLMGLDPCGRVTSL